MILLLFGTKKLPELARGSGRALRILKAETKGLGTSDEEDDLKTPHQVVQDRRQAILDEADRIRSEQGDAN